MLTYARGYFKISTGQIEYFYFTWNGNKISDGNIALMLDVAIESYDEICQSCGAKLSFDGLHWEFYSREKMERAMMTLRLMK